MTNKFGAKKTQVHGIWFDSKAEAMHYLVLKDRERKREIGGLVLQPAHVLVVNGSDVGTYTGDFGYVENGQRICEDTKGVKTEAFRLRAKVFQACYPEIELRVNGKAAKRPKVHTTDAEERETLRKGKLPKGHRLVSVGKPISRRNGAAKR